MPGEETLVGERSKTDLREASRGKGYRRASGDPPLEDGKRKRRFFRVECLFPRRRRDRREALRRARRQFLYGRSRTLCREKRLCLRGGNDLLSRSCLQIPDADFCRHGGCAFSSGSRDSRSFLVRRGRRNPLYLRSPPSSRGKLPESKRPAAFAARRKVPCLEPRAAALRRGTARRLSSQRPRRPPTGRFVAAFVLAVYAVAAAKTVLFCAEGKEAPLARCWHKRSGQRGRRSSFEFRRRNDAGRAHFSLLGRTCRDAWVVVTVVSWLRPPHRPQGKSHSQTCAEPTTLARPRSLREALLWPLTRRRSAFLLPLLLLSIAALLQKAA